MFLDLCVLTLLT